MTPDVRPAIVTWANWCVEHQHLFNYREVRPMPYAIRAPINNDCSGTVTLCYYLAGAPDPNGLDYCGEGYTGTLWDHGQQVARSRLEPGDVIIYGAQPGVHCAVVVEVGADPLTVSHGQQSEPAYVRVSVGNPEPGSPETFFRYPTNNRFPVPAPPIEMPVGIGTPTPADLMRTSLVEMKNVAQAEQALHNGWHLWYWAADKFVPQIGGQPTAKTLYANKDWSARFPVPTSG